MPGTAPMRARFSVLLVFLALLLTALLRARPARADEGSPRVQIRRLLLAGDVASAQAAIGVELATDVSRAERAALLELFAVSTAWEAASGPPACIDIRQTAPPPEWNEALAAARSDLIRGAYRSAVAQLDLLVAYAGDLVDASRAVELRSLSYDVLGRGDARACARARPTARKPAGDGARVEATPSDPPQSWYGWQTLIADGAALVATPFVPAIGAGLYLTGAPIVHLAHGSLGRAAASVGVRVGVPLAGAVTGVLVWQGTTACRSHDVCAFGGVAYAAVGGGLGIIGAVALDSALLARERAVPAEARPSPIVAAVRPSLAPRREGGLDLGVFAMW